MKLITDSSFTSSEESLKTAETINDYVKKVRNVIGNDLYDAPETSINLPSDENYIDQSEKMAQSLANPQLKYIIDIGIGGSNLGTKAVYDALFGFFDILEPTRYPKMLFADTNNPVFLHKLVSFLKAHVKNKNEIAINMISKSGSTTETVSNVEIILQALSHIDGISERLVITTDEGSKLHLFAKEKKYQSLHLPKLVGGRYSVFSPVGLFPLSLAGVDIRTFCNAAVSMRGECIDDDIQNNIALQSAVILYLKLMHGKIINDNFFFHGELESLGKWYRQLMGESIGKEGKGITPTVSIGSTDLHSVAQLYYGGPHDKMTTFVYAKKTADISIPQPLVFKGLVTDIEGKKASEIMKAIIEGVKISYKNEKMPSMEIILDDISAASLGEYMQFKMMEMMYLGKLLGINTFDQPHVELYKVEMKKVLANQ